MPVVQAMETEFRFVTRFVYTAEVAVMLVMTSAESSVTARIWPVAALPTILSKKTNVFAGH